MNKAKPISPMDVRIYGRLRSKFGGTLETFYIGENTASHIPDRWTFISKVPNMPQFITNRYAMLYNTKQYKIRKRGVK